MYCSSQEIQNELKILQEKGYFTERLVEILDAMINGIFHRYANHKVVTEEDYRQTCWVLVLRKHTKAKLDGNLFAWFSTMFLNQLRQLHRRQAVPLHFMDMSEIENEDKITFDED